MLYCMAKINGKISGLQMLGRADTDIHSAGSSKFLSKEQEYELARKAQAGDIDARNELVNANYALVVKIARDYAAPGVSFEDLYQEGCIGLVMAAGKFNPEKNCRFSTYATSWIKKYIRQSSIRSGFSTKIPRRLEPHINKVLSFTKLFEANNNREPSVTEISLNTGISEDIVEDVLRFSKPVSEFDDKWGVSDDGCSEPLTSHSGEVMIGSLMNQELSKIFRLILTEKEHYVLSSLFCEDVRVTKKRLSQILHISVPQISAIEKEAFAKVREYFLTHNIDYRDYLTQ